MRPICFILLFFTFHQLTFAGNKESDSLLNILDETLKNKEYYIHKKEKELLQLRLQLVENNSHEEEFNLLNSLIHSYLYYNIDSTNYFISLQKKAALALNNEALNIQVQLNLAAAYISTGMYYEAMKTLDNLLQENIPAHLTITYFTLYTRTYDALAEFSIYDELKQHYISQVKKCREQTVAILDADGADNLFLRSDLLMAEGKFQKALLLLEKALENEHLSNHEIAIIHNLLAKTWRGLKNRENEKRHLVISSIHDVKASVKEYISLWQLAELLFEQGDIDRAYQYLQTSLSDATSANIRLRTNSISSIYPIIEKAYQAKTLHQQQQLHKLLLFISFLLLILIVVVGLVLLQMKRLRLVRKELKQLNSDLVNSNYELKVLNKSILENSIIKEEYIGKYIEQCLLYLEKLEEYRRWIRRSAQTKPKKELLSEIESSHFIQEELTTFYSEFDHTFLNLFPSFVEEFNALLHPDEQTIVKPNELLNTELRIYALIRLGINDSDKIARFLGYSISTIYNYRTKMRNKAAGNREEFEEMVMKIGFK